MVEEAVGHLPRQPCHARQHGGEPHGDGRRGAPGGDGAARARPCRRARPPTARRGPRRAPRSARAPPPPSRACGAPAGRRARRARPGSGAAPRPRDPGRGARPTARPGRGPRGPCTIGLRVKARAMPVPSSIRSVAAAATASGHGGGAVQLRRPEAGDAGALGRAREVREPGGVVAQERDVHRYPERSGHCASIPAVAPHRPPRHRAPHVRCRAVRHRPRRARSRPWRSATSRWRRPLVPFVVVRRPGGRHQRLEHPLDARPRAAARRRAAGPSSRRARPSAGRSWCSCCRWCS